MLLKVNLEYIFTIQNIPLASLAGFYPSTFVYSCFTPSPKTQFLYCLLSSVTLLGGPVVDPEG